MMRACRSISSNSSAMTSKEMGRSRTGGQDVAGKRLVVLDARPAHERRIGRESLDVGFGIEFQDARLVGAVGEDLDFQIVQGVHGSCRGAAAVSEWIWGKR